MGFFISGNISIGRIGVLETSGCWFESCFPDNKGWQTLVKKINREKPVLSEVEGSPASTTIAEIAELVQAFG